MKAYRIETREESKWEWGFWGLYFFSWLSLLVIGTILDIMILGWIALLVVFSIYLIINFDLKGYAIKRKK